MSPFQLTGEGVVAIDPIDADAATAYRKAIATVSSAPVCAVVYSHDHRDHIVGGAKLAEPGVEVIAHPAARDRIERRSDPDVLRPTRLLEDRDELRFGEIVVETHHFGPNHSPSTVAYVLPTDAGRLLTFVDVVEPGVAPYRELPDTDVEGMLHSLREAEKLRFDTVIGGHCGPAGGEWVGLYRRYFEALLEATRAEWQRMGGQTSLPGEDGVTMTERVRGLACAGAAARLETEFGSWRGFAEWAPKNADRVLSYLITGS